MADALPLTGEIHGAIEFQREVDRILKGMDFKVAEPKSPHFRPETKLPCRIQNYWLGGGGIGDKVCFLPALVYLATECPWILGRAWVPEFMVELFKNIIDQTGNPEWRVLPIERFGHPLYENDTPIKGRGFKYNDGKEHLQHVNGAGGSLTWIGFMDTMNRFPPPDGKDIMPMINFERWEQRPELLHKEYVVLTTGAVAESRQVPGQYWNPVIEHIKSKGLTPVFLGAHEIPAPKAKSERENPLWQTMHVKFSDGCNYGEGLDLRDKTTLMEAAWIMKNARAVIGLDNGLIQLATLTDANIICAYSTVDPKDRRPNRRAGRWTELVVPFEELACSRCQTYMTFIAPPHNFKSCLYGDYKCIHLLFKNESERFCQALDRILA